MLQCVFWCVLQCVAGDVTRFSPALVCTYMHRCCNDTGSDCCRVCCSVSCSVSCSVCCSVCCGVCCSVCCSVTVLTSRVHPNVKHSYFGSHCLYVSSTGLHCFFSILLSWTCVMQFYPFASRNVLTFCWPPLMYAFDMFWACFGCCGQITCARIVAVCCSVLQCVVEWHVLSFGGATTRTRRLLLPCVLQCIPVCSSVLQCVAVRCRITCHSFGGQTTCARSCKIRWHRVSYTPCFPTLDIQG